MSLLFKRMPKATQPMMLVFLVQGLAALLKLSRPAVSMPAAKLHTTPQLSSHSCPRVAKVLSLDRFPDSFLLNAFHISQGAAVLL